MFNASVVRESQLREANHELCEIWKCDYRMAECKSCPIAADLNKMALELNLDTAAWRSFPDEI